MESKHLLWMGAAVVSAIVVSGYGFLGLHMWLRSRRVLGPTSRDVRETLRELSDISRECYSQKETRLMLLYMGIGVLILSLAAREWLGVVVAAAPFILIWWMRKRTTTAPAVLMLGTSSATSIERQRNVKRRISPLRVVSLLDTEIPWNRDLAREMALDCFRTANDEDWWIVVTRLMNIAPVIAIDTAADTAGVLREMKHILGTELVRRCVFLTPPDGSAPILDRLLPATKLDRRHLQLARYEAAPRVIAAMVAAVANRSK